MTPITCPQESCKKEIEKPVVVTNFSSTPKETYNACPYCLTKIDLILTECSATSNETEEATKSDTSAIRQKVLEVTGPQKATLESIKKLEKEKADLLTELDKLRRGAEKKISDLETEVDALRGEAETLRELVED